MDGCSAERIADESFVSIATVRSQIRSILEKLDVRSQLAAVALAHRAEWTPQVGSTRCRPASGAGGRTFGVQDVARARTARRGFVAGVEETTEAEDRHPQPMQPCSRSRSRSSIAICASRRGRQERDRRSQSLAVGVRCWGSDSNAARTSARLRPTSCAARGTNETRRIVSR